MRGPGVSRISLTVAPRESVAITWATSNGKRHSPEPPICAGNGGTDRLRRSDQADLERRDLLWLRRSRPLMLDMPVSGLRDSAAGCLLAVA